MRHWFFLSIAALFLVSPASGQETRTPITGWKSIQTEHFEVIFPPGAEAQAQRAAVSLEAIYEPLHIDNRRGTRLPVVLSGDGAISNGYATLLPRHSTFYLTPISDYDELNHTLNWVDTLAIHEYRHIVQFLHAKRGIPKVLGWLFGPIAEYPSYALILPPWYFEGDAVLMETALTEGGRGRRPSFDVDLRALTAARGVLTYDQYISGSIKRPIPNHYRFGYHMVSYGREVYGERVWRDTAQMAATWSPLPFVFPLSLKKTTGRYLRGFSTEMMNTRAKQWEEQRKQTSMTDAEDILLPPSEGEARFIRSPQPQQDGSMVAFQKGQDIAPRVVRISPDGSTTVLAQTGFRLTNRISAVGGTVVWDEIEFHPLRSSRSYSVIRILRPDGTLKNLTTKSALFSPALSPDGSKVVAVLRTPEQTPALVLLDATTGEVTWQLDYPVHHWLRTPSWAPDGRSVAVVHLTDHDGVGIEQVDIASKQRTTLIQPSHTPLSKPTLSSDYLFYSSPASGLDAIWAQSLSDGSRYRVASRPFAAMDPVVAPDEQHVYFADYTYLGTGIQRVALNPAMWEAAEEVRPVFVDTISPTIAQTQKKVSFGAPDTLLPEKRYLRFPRLRDAVAWTLPLDQSGGNVTLMDPTNLVSMSLSAGFKEDFSPQGSIEIDYRGLPVILSGSVGTQQRFGSLGEVPDTSEESPNPTEFSIPDLNTSWIERNLQGGVALPVWFRRGAWDRGLQLDASASLREVTDILVKGEPKDAIDTSTGPLETGIRKEVTASAQLYQGKMQAPMALAPAWSQSLRYTHTLTPFGGALQGAYQAAELELGFPGFAPLHNLQLSTSWQHSDGDYALLPQVFSPRTYELPNEGSVLSGGLTYRLPLVYPDISFTSLAFLKRISGGLFYEAAQDLTDAQTPLVQTVGAEFWTTGTIFRLPGDVGLDIAVDIGWRVDRGEPFASIQFLGSTWSTTESSSMGRRQPLKWRR